MSILSGKIPNICAILTQIAPRQPCMLCGAMGADLWCKACDAALPYLDAARCPVCAHPTPDGKICGHCLQCPPAFDDTVAVFSYRFPIDKLIQQMKYHERLALSKIFAQKLLPRIDALPDCLIPMPLHPEKLRRRGFNQAQLIAQPVARALHIPLRANACSRLRDTPSQTGLPWEQRDANVRGAFRCEIDLAGRHVALVDDVMTSGASMNALALQVRECGAARISAWVVARAVRGD